MGLDPEFAEEEDGKWWSIVPGGVANNCAFEFSRCVTRVHRRYAAAFDRRFRDFDKAFALGILPRQFFA